MEERDVSNLIELSKKDVEHIISILEDGKLKEYLKNMLKSRFS